MNMIDDEYSARPGNDGAPITTKLLTNAKAMSARPYFSAGKSTFLNIVGGLEAADSGRIRVGDAVITELSDRDVVEYRRRQLGFVFQFYNLVPDLTVTENIEVCQYLSSDPLPMEPLLRSLGLWEHRRKFPHEISGGQQQRCAIGRALVKNPGLLLCDEPTGALDYNTGKAILRLLQTTCYDTGKTVVLITHNQAFTSIANRVIHVREGRADEVVLNEHPASAETLEW